MIYTGARPAGIVAEKEEMFVNQVVLLSFVTKSQV